MAIVIKEIILSDTLEKFMEKVNFNFDQLLLAGGGPPGPVGPSGPVGPAGPKGDPGNKWYVGCTGTSSAIGTTLYDGDLFLAIGCSGSTYQKGDVFEWDDFTNTFVNTTLNLVGPTGPTGQAGANLFGGIFPGTQSGSVWLAQGEAAPGPTANFYLLKGDTDYIGLTYGTGPSSVVAGTTSTYSRDILWLGGLRSAQFRTDEWSLDTFPKLFVSPRRTWPSNPASAGVAYNNKAGGGISIGIEPTDYTLPSTANPNSWSNIFVDDKMNLRITNYTDFAQAGAISNSINIESQNAIRLLTGPGPLPSTQSSYNFQQGNTNTADSTYGIDWDVIGGIPNIFDAGGHIFNQTLPDSRYQIDIDSESVTRISGGGSKSFGAASYYPSLHLSNESFTNNGGIDGANYTILIDANSAPNVDDDWIGSPQSGYITKGASLAGANGYLGLGVSPSALGFTPYLNAVNDFFDLGKGVNIGLPGTIDTAWHQNTQYSLDVVGRIRMRDSATAAGYVITDSDGTGSGVWTNPLEVGAWIEDPACEYRIIIGDPTKYASTINSANLNYSRFDIAINDSGSGKYGDLYFANYDSPSASYSISIDTDDDLNEGQLSFNHFSSLPSCQSDLSGRQVTGLSKIMTMDNHGRIRIGGDADSPSGGNAPGMDDKLYIQSSATAFSSTQIASNIQLRNDGSDGYASPLLKFSFGGPATGFNTYFDDETAMEVFRVWSGTNNGKMNIRFRGVGKASTSAESGNTGKSAIQAASGGASVLMISDREDAIARDGTPGRTNDYFELTHSDMYIDRIRLNYASKAIDRGSQVQTNHVSNLIALEKWGSVGSGWNTFLPNYPFKGSRNDNAFSNDLAPNRSGQALGNGPNGLSITNLIAGLANPLRSGEADGLSVWHSPTTSFRYMPMNFDQPNPNTGLAYINFNIDMGVVIDTSEELEWGAGPTSNFFSLCGPGSIATQTDDSSDFTTFGDLADAVKIQSVRVKLDSNAIKGLGPMLDDEGVTNRDGTLDPYNPGADSSHEGRSRKNWETDWMPGVCKAMYDTMESNNSTTNNLQDKGAFRHPHAGVQYYIDKCASNSWSFGFTSVITPFADNAAAGAFSPVGYQTNASNINGGFGAVIDFVSRPVPKWQQASVAWRLERKYTGNPSNPQSVDNEVWLHIVYLRNPVSDGIGRSPYDGDYTDTFSNMVPTSSSGAFGSVPTSGADMRPHEKRSYGQLGSPYLTDIIAFPSGYDVVSDARDDWWNSTENNFGIPINYLVMPRNWSLSSVEKNSAEYLMTSTIRRPEFYDSHGISFSGGGLVKWNTGSRYVSNEVVVGPGVIPPPPAGEGEEEEAQGPGSNILA